MTFMLGLMFGLFVGAEKEEEEEMNGWGRGRRLRVCEGEAGIVEKIMIYDFLICDASGFRLDWSVLRSISMTRTSET